MLRWVTRTCREEDLQQSYMKTPGSEKEYLGAVALGDRPEGRGLVSWTAWRNGHIPGSNTRDFLRRCG